MRLFQPCATLTLLIGLCTQQIDAFGSSLKANPPRSATLFPSSKLNIAESDFPTRSNRISAQTGGEIASDDGEAIFKAVETSIAKEDTTTRRLLWSCMILMLANLSSDMSGFSNVPDDVASAAVTASFIRSSRPSRRISGKQLAVGALLVWRLIPLVRKLLFVAPTILSRFLNFYVGNLEAFPLITKACSSAVIAFLGDSCAQQFEARTRVKREGSNASPAKYNVRRGLSTVAGGLFITGPALHFVYNFLEHLIPVSGSALPPSLAALSQVLLDDFFVDSVFVAITFIFTGLTEGYGMKTFSQLKTDFVPTVKAGWATSLFLMPLEFTCFRFLPISFRVLGMNFVDIVWDGVMSFQVHKSRTHSTRETATLADHGFSGEDAISYAL